jgi:hypothetical protein
MGYCVALAEMWTAMKDAGFDDEAKALAEESEALMKRYADKFAEKIGVGVTTPTMEQHEMAGLAAVFFPLKPGDPIPDCLRYFDSEEEWEP